MKLENIFTVLNILVSWEDVVQSRLNYDMSLEWYDDSYDIEIPPQSSYIYKDIQPNMYKLHDVRTLYTTSEDDILEIWFASEKEILTFERNTRDGVEYFIIRYWNTPEECDNLDSIFGINK